MAQKAQRSSIGVSVSSSSRNGGEDHGQQQEDIISDLNVRMKLLEGEVRLLLIRNLGIQGQLDGLGGVLLYSQNKVAQLETQVRNLLAQLGNNAGETGIDTESGQEQSNESSLIDQSYQYQLLLSASAPTPLPSSILTGSITGSSLSARPSTSGPVSSGRNKFQPPPPQLRRIGSVSGPMDMSVSLGSAEGGRGNLATSILIAHGDESSSRTGTPTTAAKVTTAGTSTGKKKAPAKPRARKSRAKGANAKKSPAAVAKKPTSSARMCCPGNIPTPEDDDDDGIESEAEDGQNVQPVLVMLDDNGGSSASSGESGILPGVEDSKNADAGTSSASATASEHLVEEVNGIGEVGMSSDCGSGLAIATVGMPIFESPEGKAGAGGHDYAIANGTITFEHGSNINVQIIKDEPLLTNSTLADVGNTIPVVGAVATSSTPKKQPAKRKRTSGPQSKRQSVKKVKLASEEDSMANTEIATVTPAKGKKKGIKSQGNIVALGAGQSPASGLQFAPQLYRCGKCSSNFQTEILLAQHMELHMAIGGPNNADNASITSVGSNNGNGDHQANFYCLVCYRGFKTEYHLQAHSVVHAPR